MMRHALYAAAIAATLLSAAPALAIDLEYSVGIRGGMFVASSTEAYEGQTATHVENMDGDTSGSTFTGLRPVPSLSQQVRPFEYFAVELEERWWQTAVKGVFLQAPGLNYRLSKTVVPVALIVKGVLPLGSPRFLLTLGAGPALCFVVNDERGWFGSGHSVDAAPGLRVQGGLTMLVAPRVGIRLDLGGDWFDIPGKNVVMQDGGAGGGFTALFGLDIIIDPKHWRETPGPKPTP